MENNNKEIPSFKNQRDVFSWIINLSPKMMNSVIKQPLLRRGVLKILEKYLKKSILENKDFPQQVQMDKFYMSKALADAVSKVLDGAKKHSVYRQALTESVLPQMLNLMKKGHEKSEKFNDDFGFNPPGFLTISPGKLCNLKCTGCYANSSSGASEKLTWDVVDKIITEKTEKWGSWFTVISGGEPLLWKSQGKTIIDIAKKHQNNFFLMYTNSTLIDKEMAEKLAEVANITPAISVEGFEKETDRRRGKGIHKKILEAMKNLNEVGVPFGISLTATRKNSELITSKKLMDYYRQKGALYAWIFQLMPIGQGSIDLMVTPEQRLRMFRRTQKLIKKGYFVADFWNCGAVSNGCISAGKATGGGYLYIEWNGNVTPCVFNPYAAGNINEIYKKGGSLNQVLKTPYFKKIKRWQEDYGLGKKADEVGNWILPCPIRDHYQDMKRFISETKPTPIDEAAKKALNDKIYAQQMTDYDNKLAETFDPVWEKEYLKKTDD